MRRWSTVLAAACVAVLAASCASEADTGQTTDDVLDTDWAVACAPGEVDAVIDNIGDIELACLADGADVPVGVRDGQPLLIAIWASWCPPCHEEAPHVEAFAQLAQGQVAVLGVDSEDVLSHGRAFAGEYDWTFPSVFDPSGQVRKSLGVTGVPGFAFVDESGSVVHLIGQQGITTSDLIEAANAHLDVDLKE
ncbi:TlpA family protein disulfide reductase [Natronoglycomyces albus]|uniref:TlpA family protein disulfide reductase n=1 Tax=Natronoglycomyces albus TaxID=2811108 RepID=A0A895XGG3_9ACTN|nr:TlpA disulfide reductase family protein [Natronoglycomyces albus]QSB04951.1 TlpA family protein disulfide reductase [Natronoglycomyces albus]